MITYRKTAIALLSLVMLSGLAKADNEQQGMLIQKTDGTQVQIALSSLRSIRFAEGMMQINQTDNTQQQIAVDDIAQITFGSLTTAIRSIVDDTKQHIVIADISGRIIYEGAAADYRESDIAPGTYVISQQGQSRKITIQ